jgi:hypothetical protein
VKKEAESKLKEMKKAAKKSGTKYGVKTGAPPKRIEKMEDFVPFRDSVLTWILVNYAYICCSFFFLFWVLTFTISSVLFLIKITTTTRHDSVTV